RARTDELAMTSSAVPPKALGIFLLCFALVMLVVAAYRAGDPVVGARWQRFIELVMLLALLGALPLGVRALRRHLRKRRTARSYYDLTRDAGTEVPVTPATVALRPSPTRTPPP